MYWYYFQTARGIKVWWKEWITRLQIAQFVIDLGKCFMRLVNGKPRRMFVANPKRLGFIYFACWDYYVSVYAPWLPHVGRCAGKPLAAWMGCIILSSYLVLFVMFYIATYRKVSARKVKAGIPKDTKSNVSTMKESAHKVADSCSGVAHSHLLAEK